LDVFGPWEFLGAWNKFAKGPEGLIVAETTAPVICAKGASINPHVSFEQCPALDFLLVPGGEGTRKEVDNDILISFIAKQAKICKAILSVCTGSFLLHKAGLLSGKKTTTHWGSLDRLRAAGGVTVIEERFVQDGNIWSSAGISTGMDMMLAFIKDFAGEETAGIVQFAVEYYPSTKSYGGFDKNPKAPAYCKRKA